MGGVSSPIPSPVADTISAPISRRRYAEQITSAPAKVASIVLTRGSYSVAASGATNQQLDVVVEWPRPSMAQRYDVYIGATAETIALVSDNQLARAYVPTLALDSTYYFRIDAVNDLGTTAGDVCSFSTWAAADIWTDKQTGIPWTDDYGNYIPHDRD